MCIRDRANSMKLGDVAQSMIVRDTIGWVVVNNSHVIFAISTNTFKEDVYKRQILAIQRTTGT